MQNNKLTNELFIFGCIITLLTLEAGRRVLGNVLPIIAIVAILYAFFGDQIPGLFGHRGYSLRRITLAIFSDRGVYGSPIGTSANNVYLFLLFAAYLNVSHADVILSGYRHRAGRTQSRRPRQNGRYRQRIVRHDLRKLRGERRQHRRVHHPLMKRNGYQSKFAGAVEAVASTGGQIMPPIMGAAAFVLADATPAHRIPSSASRPFSPQSCITSACSRWSIWRRSSMT